jgi:sugar (pentulose or hexulose) kinase
MLCLGLDSATTTCKGLGLDVDKGKVLAQATAPHLFVEGLPQDPQVWSEAAERVILSWLEKIGERRSEVMSFGVSAQQNALVTLDDRDIFGLPIIGCKMAEGAALGAAIHASWTYCQTKGEQIPLEKMVKSAVVVDRKTHAQPRNENQAFYAELRGRHADLTRKLASSG